MIVYRVEDGEGTGAYRLRDAEGDDVINTACSDEHPSPHDDDEFVGLYISDYIFGFESLDDLHRWFGEDLKKPLRAAGALISVYDADECYYGDRQAIFNPLNCTLLKELPL